MKRLGFLNIILLLLLAFASEIQAGIRSAEEAMAIAGRFMAESKKDVSPAECTRRAMIASLDAEPMELVFTQMHYAEAIPSVYVFNHTEDGYVVVAADDRARGVLGYSTEPLVEGKLPANMQVWLQMYADEIARMGDSEVMMGSDVDYYPTVEPLLGKTAWNQSAPYNNHCPIDQNTMERSVTGCMATATAQVMYHHKYPKSGTGSHSYNWRGKTLTVDFSQATYDWEHMLPVYKNGNYTQEEADAVAQLMYHVGVACDMEYSSSASGAGMGSSMVALMKYFDYDAGIEVLSKDHMDEEVMLSKMALDLQASRPIQIEALTKRNEGHAFVCDGMQSNGYVHINWGWGGYADGYFALSAMNPINQGIGGASDDGAFTESVTAYLGVKPNEGGTTIPVLLAEKITLKSKVAIAKNENVKFGILNLQNGGVGQEQGNVAYMLYQEDSLCYRVDAGCEWRMGPMSYYPTERNAEASLASVAAGTYKMIVGVRVDEKPSPYPIYVRYVGEKRYNVTVTEDSVFLKEDVKGGYFGTNYEMGQVTDMSAKTGTNNLRLMIQTADFVRNKKGQVTSGSALVMDLFPSSVESLLGSFAVDATNSQTVGTLGTTYTVSMACVNEQSVVENMQEGIATISLAKGGYYVIDYSFKSDKNSFEGQCKIASENLKVYRQTGTMVNTYILSNDTQTAAPMGPVAKWIKLLADEEESLFPLMVKGIVSQVDVIDTENGYATFQIADDEETILCRENLWLDKSAFVAGNELAVGDTVVIAGYGQCVEKTNAVLHGYVYAHSQYVSTNSSVDDVKDGNMTMYAEGRVLTIYATPAREVVVYDVMGRVVASAKAAERMTLMLPASGCYIVNGDGLIEKIMIE